MTALDRAASLIHDHTCRDNQHDGPESEYPCAVLAREVLAAGQVEPPAGKWSQDDAEDLHVALLEIKSDGIRPHAAVGRILDVLTPRQPATYADPNYQPLDQVDAEHLFAALAHYDSEVERAQRSVLGESIAILAGADLANSVRDALKDAGLIVAGESDG